MKKLHVILLLILVLTLGIFGGIYIGKSSKTNGISKQEIFENDLKCQEKLDDYRNELRAKGYTDIFVFYSPIENSCLGTFQSYNLYNNETRYNGYSYTIEKLSDLNKYAYFSITNYYSGNDLIGIKHITDKFTDNECDDIDYRFYEDDKEYYDSLKKCKFTNIKEIFDKELEYLKGN